MSRSRRRESKKSWRRQRERFAGQVQGFYVPWDQLLANERSSRDQHPALRSAGRFSRNWVSYSTVGGRAESRWSWTLTVRRRTFSRSGDETPSDNLPSLQEERTSRQHQHRNRARSRAGAEASGTGGRHFSGAEERCEQLKHHRIT